MSKKTPSKTFQQYQRQLEMLAKEEQKRRETYKDFVESIQGLPPLEKSESWLRYVSDNAGRYSDQEAIVYLASRGHDCGKFTKRIVATWRLAEKQVIERCMYGASVYDLDTRKQSRRGGLSERDAKDILNRSPFELHDFWSGSREEGLFVDAIMFRTVQWCDIGGFDKWWQRYAREQLETTIQGGIELLPASYYLFAMTRCDFALRLLEKGLLRLLEAVEIPDSHPSYPWKRLNLQDSPKLVDHYPLAATLAFANKRLRKDQANRVLVDQSLEELLAHQCEDGGWKCWEDDSRESIEATAMVVHALALNRPRGWEMAVSGANDWLLKQQDRTGCWYEDIAPFEVYLTVLVLDALALGQNKPVTFIHSTSPPSTQASEISSDKIGILFLTANPGDTDVLRLDEQIRLIDEKIRASEHRDRIDLKSRWAVRADDLLQVLNTLRPHVVHFSGHGSDRGNILVIGKDGNAHPISTKALKALFRTLRGNCRIVILDACYSRAQAHALVNIVDCAIGMDGAVGQAAATAFTASFYRALGFGCSVQEAFDCFFRLKIAHFSA